MNCLSTVCCHCYSAVFGACRMARSPHVMSYNKVEHSVTNTHLSEVCCPIDGGV